MAEVDLAMAFNLAPALLEQLGKALIELEAHKEGTTENVSFTEISEHYHDLEAKMMKKYSELKSRENAFKQEESDAHALLAEKEAAVVAKEQDMFDRIQVLKDAAVAAIAETRANHLPPPVYTVYTNDVIDGADNKVSCSLGESSEKTSGEISFLQELTQFCEQMDPKGLLNFIMENRKNITVLCEELSHALKSSTEPGRLVLDSLDGFWFNPNNDAAALQGMRQSCISIIEAMNAMLARAGSSADHLLNHEIKQQAKAIADEWMPKLAHDGIVETEAFLQLIATFRVASEFDEDELCKLVLAVAEQRQVPELCRSLGLAHKMPGVLEELISKGKLISAVHFVHAFELVDRFPTVPLLKTYLKDMRRNSQGRRGNLEYDGNAKELEALRAVIYCVQKYGLEPDYPLDPLHKRVGQLQRAKTDKKRFRESSRPPPHHKKSRTSGGAHLGYRRSAAALVTVNGRQPPAPVYIDRPPYAGAPSERYHPPHHAGPSDPYNYQAAPQPGPATYSQQVYEQSAYYYPSDDRAAAATAPPAYGGYAGSGVPSSYQPYL